MQRKTPGEPRVRFSRADADAGKLPAGTGPPAVLAVRGYALSAFTLLSLESWEDVVAHICPFSADKDGDCLRLNSAAKSK